MRRLTVMLLFCMVVALAPRAQLMLDGRHIMFDSRTNSFLATIPDSLFGHDVEMAVTVDGEYSFIMIDGSIVGNDHYTFRNVSPNKSYSIAAIRRSSPSLSASIQFTYLPLIQLRGDIGYSNVPATFIMSLPGSADNDTIGAKARWRGGTTNVDGKHKRNYKVEFSDGDHALLGMRSDDDWILDAGQADVFRLRHRVAMDLWNDMATPPYYAAADPRARMGVSGKVVELFLGDEYRGIYTLQENIDRKQARVKKVADGEVRGCLYKGKTWSYTTMYDTLYIPTDNHSEQWAGFEVKYPALDDCDTTDWGPLHDAIDFVVMSSDREFSRDVSAYFDIPPLLDHALLVLALNAVDNYGKNMFWAVYDKRRDRRLTPGAWDLDCTVGQRWAARFNRDFLSPELAMDMPIHVIDRLIANDTDGFIDTMRRRWAELRQDGNVLATDSLVRRYKNYADLVARCGAAKREAARWNFDSDVNYEAIDIEAELQYITNWLRQHLEYVDGLGLPTQQHTNAIKTVDIGTYTPHSGTAYDLTGRPVPAAEMKRGIYIVGGRKIIKR